MKKNIFLIIIIIIIIISVFSCKKDIKISFNNLSSKRIILKSIKLDSINYSEIKSSLSGFLEIRNDSIYFIDKRFGFIFSFDSIGVFHSKKMGQGKGPDEINTAYIDGFTSLVNGDRFFLGSSFDVHVHNSESDRKYIFSMGWKGNQNVKKVRLNKNPDPKEFALYTLDYENLILRPDSHNNIFIPIYGENDKFNGFSNKKYYLDGRILAKLNLKSKKIEKILGRRSKKYLDYKYIGQHAYFSYDIDKKDNFYISHEIDSLIYVYNKDYVLKYTFGNKGINMDTDYYEVPFFNIKEVRKAFFDSKPKKGWYGFVEYIDDYDLFFRSYKKNKKSKFDGLQIYKNNQLISDINVPKGFRVIGNIENVFYSDVLVENDTILKSYYFKLNKQLLR